MHFDNYTVANVVVEPTSSEHFEDKVLNVMTDNLNSISKLELLDNIHPLNHSKSRSKKPINLTKKHKKF